MDMAATDVLEAVTFFKKIIYSPLLLLILQIKGSRIEHVILSPNCGIHQGDF